MINEEILRRKKVKEIHNFSTWAKRMPKKTIGFSVNYSLSKKDFCDPEDLRTWELVWKKSMNIGRLECKSTEYMWRNPRPLRIEELILIQITECNSYLNAHESIIDIMMSCTAPKLPSGEQVGLNIGDVCFGGYTKIPVGIIFARDNLMIDIHSVGTNDVSVKEIATKIDEMIRGELEVKISKKEIDKISAIKKVIRLGDKILLSTAGYDLNDEKLKYKVIASGGQIFRENHKLYYHANKSGKQSVSVFVLDENDNLLKSVEYSVTVKNQR